MNRLIFLILTMFMVNICYAETVVRFTMQQGLSENTVDLKLFDIEKPVTVSNFMSYITDTSFENSFIHRSVPGFIVQGGGYKYDINNTDFSSSYFEIPDKGTILNEPGISNLRGTIAMAKVAVLGPDSATSEWFINLADNSGTLDSQNGGFTVFGEVLNNGMSVIDSAANMPFCDLSVINPVFSALPLDNCALNPVQTDNLLRIKSAKELFTITPDLKFGFVAPATTSQTQVIVENTGSESLQLGNVSAVAPLAAPFTVNNSTCSNITLNPGTTCSITVSFSPVEQGTYSGSFIVSFPVPGLDYEISLSGFGGTSSDFFTITPNIDFGKVTSGSNVQPEVIIENTGAENLQIGLIGSKKSLAAPFTAIDSICKNKVLLPGEKCAVTVLFAPKAPGIYTDIFDIELPDLSINYEVSLVGEGKPAVDEPDILVSYSSIFFGTVRVIEPGGSPYTSYQLVQNIGQLPMDISISLEGPSQDEITLGGSCSDFVKLPPGDSCFLNILVAPVTPGNKSVTIAITTNDPDENPFLIPVKGVAEGGGDDNDAISASIENAGLNGGDGNNDGVLDSKQNRVVSLPDLNGTYVTFVSVNGARFSQMRVLESSEFGAVDNGLTLVSGAFEYVIEGIPKGGILDVGIIYPVNWVPDAYYLYGATPDNTELHWYKFEFEGNTGTFLFNNSTMASTSIKGSSIVRNLLSLRFEDGGRGDADLTADGKITVRGAASLSLSDGGAGGLISHITLLVLSVLLLCCRRQVKL